MKKQCKTCGKRRDPKFFDTPRSYTCQMCAIAKKNNVKVKVVVVKSLPELKNTAQRAFNKYIRERDKDLPCISCGKTKVNGWEAGHYWAQGKNGALRYDEQNVNKQCTSCNKFDHGNLLNYRIGLVNKIGEHRVKWLDANRRTSKKWTRDELNMIIDLYKNKLAMLQATGDSSTMS